MPDAFGFMGATDGKCLNPFRGRAIHLAWTPFSLRIQRIKVAFQRVREQTRIAVAVSDVTKIPAILNSDETDGEKSFATLRNTSVGMSSSAAAMLHNFSSS